MSIASIDIILGRIESSEVGDGIAVFRLPKPDGAKLEAVFARTIRTARRIRAKDTLLVGVYDKAAVRADVHRLLRKALDAGADLGRCETCGNSLLR